jgi:N-acetylglucosamine-6-phosphate deacetylase
MRTLIKNAKIVMADKVFLGAIAFENGIIDYIGEDEISSDKVIDADGSYVVPGFVEIHCHGGNNLEFMDASAEEFGKIAEFHMAHGTTTLYPTTVTASEKEILCALDTFAEYKKNHPNSTLIGAHLEGPFVNPKQSGALDPDFMKLPSIEKVMAWKEKYPFIDRISAAPELEGGFEFGEAMEKMGIVVSAGHTDASFSDLEEALKHGYRLITHLYSGMKMTERVNAYRVAGGVEAGLYFDEYTVEMITDGKHLPKELLKYIYKLKGADRICMITDAIRAAGLPNGSKTKIGSMETGLDVIVEDDVAKLPNRQAFAGSTATSDRLFKVMYDVLGKSDEAMIAISKMMSRTPSRVMGLSDRGEIAVGKLADLVILKADTLDVERVITDKVNI